MRMRMTLKMKIKSKVPLGTPKTDKYKMKCVKLKILRIDESGYASNKKIDTNKLKLKLKLKLSPKKRKKLLEEIYIVETWCKKNR